MEGSKGKFSFLKILVLIDTEFSVLFSQTTVLDGNYRAFSIVCDGPFSPTSRSMSCHGPKRPTKMSSSPYSARCEQ